MPRQSEAMKDVLTCDKPREDGKSHYTLGFPNGETHLHKQVSASEYIACLRRTRGTETSKYPKEKKSIEIPAVAASDPGTALKPFMRQWNLLERRARQGDSPVHDGVFKVKSSRTGHVISCLNMGGPSSKAKYS